MTMPPEEIIIECPQCHQTYPDWTRGSINLDLEDFDEDYLEQCSTATCPHCGYQVQLNTVIVQNGTFYLQDNF